MVGIGDGDRDGKVTKAISRESECNFICPRWQLVERRWAEWVSGERISDAEGARGSFQFWSRVRIAFGLEASRRGGSPGRRDSFLPGATLS